MAEKDGKTSLVMVNRAPVLTLTPPHFRVRNPHPNILIGTASERYAGWIGQIYAEGRYKKCLKCAKVPRMPSIGFAKQIL